MKRTSGKSANNIEKSINISEKAEATLKYLLKNNLPPTPENYSLWFNRLQNPVSSRDHSMKKAHCSRGADRRTCMETTDIIASMTEVLEELESGHNDHSANITSFMDSWDSFSSLNDLPTLLEDAMRLYEANLRIKNGISAAKSKIKTLREKAKKLVIEAFSDELTGLFNRRAYEKKIRDEEERYRRYKTPCSLLMLDIDHFKSVNDNYGHKVGDEVLVSVAENIKSSLRALDVPARYGGEEFAIILPNIIKENAYIVAERIRKRIESAEFKTCGQNFGISASLGVSQFEMNNGKIDGKEDVFQRADFALYTAKSLGRNKTVLDSEVVQ